MHVLGLIPARSGSKGVPGKNIRQLFGRPLLAYTAEAALASKRLARVLLSTDDPAIADVGRKWGVDVPFLRPAALARDDTPTLPVVLHAMEWCVQSGCTYDAVCLLQPTHPLRRAWHIDLCIDMLESSGADSVVTVLPVPHEHHPHWVYYQTEDKSLVLSTGESAPTPRRQDLPRAYHREGSIYVTRWDVVWTGRSLYGRRTVGFEMSATDSVNIDTLDDWLLAERMMRERAA